MSKKAEHPAAPGGRLVAVSDSVRNCNVAVSDSPPLILDLSGPQHPRKDSVAQQSSAKRKAKPSTNPGPNRSQARQSVSSAVAQAIVSPKAIEDSTSRSQNLTVFPNFQTKKNASLTNLVVESSVHFSN